MMKNELHKCFYCGFISNRVECKGMWHCPNALCSGTGAYWFRRKLKSFKDEPNRHHSVCPHELYKKGKRYMIIQKLKRFLGFKHNL